MKRILAGLALASAATLVTATPAQAAPADPVKALKKQYAAGKGVRISESAVTKVSGTKTDGTVTTNGTLAFGKSGIVASDLRIGGKGASLLSAAPPRSITVGKYTYAQGGLFSQQLPDGKKWVRYPNTGIPRTGNQPLDIFRPKVLKELVSEAKSVKGGSYRGAITFGRLAKLYGEKVDKRLGKVAISYVLDVNSKGLVSRLRSQYAFDFGLLGKTTSTVNTRYTGWGSKVTVKAPPADQVIDYSELGEDSGVPQEIPDSSLDALNPVE